jgi:hypothetical protein
MTTSVCRKYENGGLIGERQIQHLAERSALNLIEIVAGVENIVDELMQPLLLLLTEVCCMLLCTCI